MICPLLTEKEDGGGLPIFWLYFPSTIYRKRNNSVYASLKDNSSCPFVVGWPQTAMRNPFQHCYHSSQLIKVEIQKNNNRKICAFCPNILISERKRKKPNNNTQKQPTRQEVDKTQSKWCKIVIHYIVQTNQPVFKQWLHGKDQATILYGCTSCYTVWNIPLISLGDLAWLCPSFLWPPPAYSLLWQNGVPEKVLTLRKGLLGKKSDTGALLTSV